MASVRKNCLPANSIFVTTMVAYRPRTLKCITQRVLLGDTDVGFYRLGGLLLRYRISPKAISPNKRHGEVGEDRIESFGG